jgi:tryptophan synthase beta chain
MGAHDVERQAPNVFRMKLLGAEVIPVTSGRGTLKDAMNDALRDWVTNVRDTFYCIGTVAGPHPYPAMVRDFQAIIGKETRSQMQAAEGRLPDTLIAAIGGGSNAMGLFHPFLDDPEVAIIGVEAGGKGVDDRWRIAPPDRRAAGRSAWQPHLPLAGRRRPDPGRPFDFGGPRLSGHRAGTCLAEGYRAGDLCLDHRHEALAAFQLCCAAEGIIPALEPAHALAHVAKLAPDLPRDHLIVMNMCGRGDKDIFAVAAVLGWKLD